MQHFLGFAIPGVPYGCTYAIVAVGLVLTYQATGVFNFAFGAQAYTSAFVYTKLVQNENLPIWLAFVISVVVLAPLLGLAFDHFLFRRIPNTNTTAKLVTGISLFIGIPFLLPVLFGAQNLYNPPSVIFNPNTVYFHVIGTPINGIYLSALVTTAVVLIALVILMRFTNLGLQMRGRLRAGVWSLSTGSTPAGWWPPPGPSRASWPGWPGSCSLRSTISSSSPTMPPCWWRPSPLPLGRRSAPCPSPP